MGLSIAHDDQNRLHDLVLKQGDFKCHIKIVLHPFYSRKSFKLRFKNTLTYPGHLRYLKTALRFVVPGLCPAEPYS